MSNNSASKMEELAVEDVEEIPRMEELVVDDVDESPNMEVAVDDVEDSPQIMEEDVEESPEMEEVAVDFAVDDVEKSPKIEVVALDDVEESHDRNGGSVVEMNVAYESDFSLRLPISSVRFRGSKLHIIDTDHDQIILQQQLDNAENRGNKTMLVKRLSPATYAQRSLRIGYTLITVIFVGFLFVFCCQVFLFLAIALPVNSDKIWSIPKVAIVLSLLSIPVMLYGLTSLMTMGCAFVVDSYRGGALFRSTAVEIIYMM
jgi:hypothetical protein